MGFLTNLLRKGDMNFLEGETLPSKFSTLVQILNNSAFDGEGDIIQVNERSFNIYPQAKDSNQFIQIGYQMDVLSVHWYFKYYQKEVIHKKDFRKVSNLSVFEQGKMANQMISEMIPIVEKHKQNVLSF